MQNPKPEQYGAVRWPQSALDRHEPYSPRILIAVIQYSNRRLIHFHPYYIFIKPPGPMHGGILPRTKTLYVQLWPY